MTNNGSKLHFCNMNHTYNELLHVCLCDFEIKDIN